MEGPRLERETPPQATPYFGEHRLQEPHHVVMGKVREKPPRASGGEEGRSHLEGCQGLFFPKGLPFVFESCPAGLGEAGVTSA